MQLWPASHSFSFTSTRSILLADNMFAEFVPGSYPMQSELLEWFENHVLAIPQGCKTSTATLEGFSPC